MKKIYQTNKWKDHSRRISEKVFKAKSREKNIRKHYLSSRRSSFSSQYRKRSKHTIIAPSNFSIINNVDQMLSFFSEYRDHVIKDHRIIFDMSRVTELTEDAILYMLSRFNYAEKFYAHEYISGNTPIDPECKKLFEESGFYKYVYALNRNTKSSNSNIFAIKDKSLVDPVVAKEIVDFTSSSLVKLEKSVSSGIYATLIECMANTINHAYKEKQPEYNRWWLIALSQKEKKCVHFTFLDNGQGIPYTIRKTFTEKFIEFIRNRKDNDLISSALNGKFRTRTNKKWRGKGLPKIKQFVDNGYIKNLKIISNDGYVSCGENGINPIDINSHFYGTLLSWDIESNF